MTTEAELAEFSYLHTKMIKKVISKFFKKSYKKDSFLLHASLDWRKKGNFLNKKKIEFHHKLGVFILFMTPSLAVSCFRNTNV